MKINDKALGIYAGSRRGIDREGFLYKKGDVNQSFKKRWFILKGNLLFYFEKSGDRSPIGVIVLENCSVEVSDSNDRYAFCIRFQSNQTSSRTYTLCADNDGEMERWMKSITSASFGYIDMLVKEFEKNIERLKELDMSEKDNGNLSQEHTHSEILLSKANLLLETFTETEEPDSVPKPPPRKSRTSEGAQLLKGKISKVNTTVNTISRMRPKSLSVKHMHRSSSAENISRDKSPLATRKTVKGTTTLNRSSEPIKEFIVSSNFVPDEFDKTTFEILHSTFGGAIWTKIGETL